MLHENTYTYNKEICYIKIILVLEFVLQLRNSTEMFKIYILSK